MGGLQIRKSARRRRQALAIWSNGLTNPGADQVSCGGYSAGAGEREGARCDEKYGPPAPSPAGVGAGRRGRRRSILRHQHDLARMRAALQALVGLFGFGRAGRCSRSPASPCPASIQGQTTRSTSRAMRAFSSLERERSVEPVSVRRFSMRRIRFRSACGPCRKAIMTQRPLIVEHVEILLHVRPADHVEDDVGAAGIAHDRLEIVGAIIDGDVGAELFAELHLGRVAGGGDRRARRAPWPSGSRWCRCRRRRHARASVSPRFSAPASNTLAQTVNTVSGSAAASISESPLGIGSAEPSCAMA